METQRVGLKDVFWSYYWGRIFQNIPIGSMILILRYTPFANHLTLLGASDSNPCTPQVSEHSEPSTPFDVSNGTVLLLPIWVT